MGPKFSTCQVGSNVGIFGNGNSALIINGVSYNISNIFSAAANVFMQKYRSEFIIMQFTSIALVIISVLLVAQCLISRSAPGKGEIIPSD
ncbi:unnamed protein product [Adineta steineri]|uniref:Uncharacterized protein n=1 Tax=Adineta steineri TaxID=433720 RepID=A0A819CYU7_9BILA|nr:unnamed protein product [Adineta steineri]CAF0815750.1 unnamed protein product [Adineta steineri]CAF3825860.1 unnamed protein product [Adineta steineri]CAF3892887.1 unnamed protein product [Adineta steineri]